MHNPEKSRVLCVVAKGSYWTMVVGGATLAVLFVGLLVLALILKIRADWDWGQFAGTVLVLVVFFAVCAGFMSLFVWARHYREDC